MPDNIQPLPDRADLCRMRIEQCAEIIKQLRGFTPDGFKFTFTIGSATIAGFDIDERESWFVIAFFFGVARLLQKRA